MREFDYGMRFDLPMLFFAFALTALVSILLGVLPVWRSSRIGPGRALRSSGRGIISARWGRRGVGILVSIETALTFVLIAVTGAMVGSFRSLSHKSRGIAIDQRMEFQITLPASRYP
jgi:putative ABC transport system permease protein